MTSQWINSTSLQSKKYTYIIDKKMPYINCFSTEPAVRMGEGRFVRRWLTSSFCKFMFKTETSFVLFELLHVHLAVLLNSHIYLNLKVLPEQEALLRKQVLISLWFRGKHIFSLQLQSSGKWAWRLNQTSSWSKQTTSFIYWLTG